MNEIETDPVQAISPRRSPDLLPRAAWLRSQVRHCLAVIGAVAHEHRVVLLASGAFWLSVSLVYPPQPFAVSFHFYVIPFLIALHWTALFSVILYRYMVRQGMRTLPGLRLACREATERAAGLRRLATIAVATAVVTLTYSAYGVRKAMMGVQSEQYVWDVPIHQLDLLLHGGRMPWELIHGIPGRAYWLPVLDFNYALWFPVLGFTLVAVAMSRRRQLRLQALLAMVLFWAVLGIFVAVEFSSAGPPYFSAFAAAENNPYDPLLVILEDAGTHAREMQLLLWDLTMGESPPPYSGFSAMPSMHIAGALLIALVSMRFGRVFGTLGLTHFILTWIGSFALGWHYAVDSYVSILLGLLLWSFAGFVIRWQLTHDGVLSRDGGAAARSGHPKRRSSRFFGVHSAARAQLEPPNG